MNFVHRTESFGPWQKHILEIPNHQTRLAVVPERGATLIDLVFNNVSVLDGYATPEELNEGKWGKSAVLFPFPNRLRDGRYDWGGKSYAFPINNAGTGNAIHGFVRHKAFRVSDITVTDQSASVTTVYEYDGHLDYYPFPCTISVTFTLEGPQKASFGFSVQNDGLEPIPAGFGWHPYFQLPDEGQAGVSHIDDHQVWVEYTGVQKVEIDERMIPTGVKTPFSAFNQPQNLLGVQYDNCFAATADGTYRLVMGRGNQNMYMEMNGAIFPFFQVFTPPHRTCVALEPMSCNVDVFNNRDGLVTLAPKGIWNGGVRVGV